MNVTDIDGNEVRGLLANDPANVEFLQPQSPVSVPVGDVNDWMIKSDNGIVGGFTVPSWPPCRSETAKSVYRVAAHAFESIVGRFREFGQSV